MYNFVTTCQRISLLIETIQFAPKIIIIWILPPLNKHEHRRAFNLVFIDVLLYYASAWILIINHPDHPHNFPHIFVIITQAGSRIFMIQL